MTRPSDDHQSTTKRVIRDRVCSQAVRHTQRSSDACHSFLVLMHCLCHKQACQPLISATVKSAPKTAFARRHRLLQPRLPTRLHVCFIPLLSLSICKLQRKPFPLLELCLCVACVHDLQSCVHIRLPSCMRQEDRCCFCILSIEHRSVLCIKQGAQLIGIFMRITTR